MDPSPTIAQQLAALPRLTVNDLQRRYAEAFGDETAARNKAWRVKRIAWKVQANAHGGLLALLIDPIGYDGVAGKVAIKFRGAGIQSLTRELPDKREERRA
ncbi:DUF2924 domain-containing protein [Limnoglobus roseus]|uniref:Uncharacterized protein n=1 Tax=Limnoglobus roseus TaxID=2598579 RepID=A0A5C1AUK1_9BACT|nr:DUF2924 domain-containing protein [Limnoglobus roseus]QEL20458.1 hypothetical protein PX52LOC_07559 [Limnoglobus roseus]